MLAGHTQVTDTLQPCGLPEHPDCGIRDVLDRIGDKWSVLAIVELSSATRRFRELQRSIHGISQRMLTLTLRRLERDGLVRRTVHPVVPPRVDYDLTPLGESLLDAVAPLVTWTRGHRDEIARARAAFDQDDRPAATPETAPA